MGSRERSWQQQGNKEPEEKDKMSNGRPCKREWERERDGCPVSGGAVRS